MKTSHLENQFATLWKMMGLSVKPEVEYRFHPPRLFRFDFAWPRQKVAVEIEGGLYHGKGGHTNVNGFNANCEKQNIAVLDGWRLLRFTERMLTNDPAGCVSAVNTLITEEKL